MKIVPSTILLRWRDVATQLLSSGIVTVFLLLCLANHLSAQLGINARPEAERVSTKGASKLASDPVWNFPTQVCDSPILDAKELFLFVPGPGGTPRLISGIINRVELVNVPPTSTMRVLEPLSPTPITAGNTVRVILSFSSTQLGTSTATLRTFSEDSLGIPIVNDFPIITNRQRRSFALVTPTYNFGTLPPNTPTTVTLPFIRNTGTVPLDWEIPTMFGAFSGSVVRPMSSPVAGNPNARTVLLQPGDTAFVAFTFPGAAAGQTVTYNVNAQDNVCRVSQPFNLQASVLQNPPNITVTPSGLSVRPVDFGVFDCPSRNAPYKDTTLRVYNSGQTTLEITGAMFSLPDYRIISPPMLSTSSPLLVPFNQSREIIVRYTPSFSNPTDRRATLTLASNAATGVTTVTLTAQKDSINITLSTRDLDFGSVQRDSPSPTRTLTVTNNGTVPQLWTPPFVLGNGFVVESVTPPLTQANGGTSLVTVRFNNTATAGQFNAVWNATDLCFQVLPVTMRINVDKPRPGIGVVSPITFGMLTCSSDTTLSVTIRNTSNDGQELVIQQMSILGGASSPFTLLSQPALPLTVQSGQPQVLQLRYRPRSTGNALDTLRFVSNADDFPVFNVVLQGTKDSVGFSISRNAISFVNLFPNISATDTLTIRNNGSTPIAWGSSGRFTLGGAFTIQSISPQVTPPNGGTSQVTVRFLGSANDASATGSFSDLCGRTQMFTVQATILPPRIAVTESIQFTPLTCETEARAAVTVRNTGGQDLVLNSITGAVQGLSIDAAPNASAPIRIAGGRDTTLMVRFTPMTTGQANAVLRYFSNAVNRDAMNSTSTTLSGVKNVRDFEWVGVSEPVFVTFGTVPPNTPVSRTFTLRNTGNLPIDWNVPLRFGPDSVFAITAITPNPTMPGAMAQVTVRYAGAACGTTYLTTQFTRILSDFGFTCTKNSSIGAFAETLPATARLRLESVSGGIGDTVEMPIRLENARFLAEAGVKTFTASMRFNQTIMYPLEANKGMVQGGNRIIPLVLPLPSPIPSDSILARIKFRITLGNTTAAQVFLDNPASGGVCITLDTASARTAAERICYAGGERLIEIVTTATALVSAKPNPVFGISTIDISLMERGFTTLTLYNTMGQVVKQLLAAPMEPGAYSLDVDASALPSGTYFAILQTPTERITRRLEVVR